MQGEDELNALRSSVRSPKICSLQHRGKWLYGKRVEYAGGNSNVDASICLGTFAGLAHGGGDGFLHILLVTWPPMRQQEFPERSRYVLGCLSDASDDWVGRTLARMCASPSSNNALCS